jgi:23S rRNA pseudouridine2604 synthase
MNRKTLSLPKREAPAKVPVASAPQKPVAPRPSTAQPATAKRNADATARPPKAGPRPTTQAPRRGDSNSRPERTAPRRSAPVAPPLPAGERLSKRVMQLKECSRSEAEQYISSGFVTVDGVVVEDPPHRVSDSATVALSPDATLLALQEVSFVLNKPPQWLDGVDDDDEDEAPRSRAGGRGKSAPPNARTLLTAEKQWPQDVTQQKFLKRYTQHLEACVPLEAGASGLVVFTQDWRVTRKLEEHLGDMEHEYMVDIAQAVETEQMQALTRLLKDPRENLPPVKASIGSNTPTSTRLRIAIKGAHPGLIAYVLGKVGLPIAALHRTRLGRVALGQVPVGQWRYLAGYEKF